MFLHEGLVDDVIAAVENSIDANLLEKVIDAAQKLRPEWVIEVCRRQAETIINKNQAQHYEAAVQWLAKARLAFYALGLAGEWKEYLGGLLINNRRKYRLVPLLEVLR